MMWVYLGLVVALIILTARGAGAFLANRSQLDAALIEIRGWECVKLRVIVGGATLIVSDLDGLRYEALQKAREQERPLNFGTAPRTLPPLIIGRTAVITADGQGWMPYGGMVDRGVSTPIILYVDDLPIPPIPDLPLFDARLGTWWPEENPLTRESDSDV